MPEEKDSTDWKESIISHLQTSTDEPIKVKKLRKTVLKGLSLDESDKVGKKSFKKTMKSLEGEGVLTIDADGLVNLVEKKSKKRKKEKKEKKKSKKQKVEENKEEEEDTAAAAAAAAAEEEEEEPEKETAEETEHTDTKSLKGVPCDGNPGGVTRLFLGNLPFAVDENSLSEFLPPTVTHIKWITDKETGKFYGSAFIEMDTPAAAAKAVALAGEKLMGRPIKINFAPARPGDVWPPAKKVILGGDHKATTGGSAGGKGIKTMGEKPENCVKLFIGNLSYDIDDETIGKFFDNVGAELKAVRWLSHRDTGDFKGCGFVEFWNTEACDKAATLNGKNLLGRPIRIDWTD